jgi:hypothetical protein
MAPSNGLTVPYAFTAEGDLIPAKQGKKGQAYFCPACQVEVGLRKGKINKPHFSHPLVANCNATKIWRQTAKLLILKTVSDWKAGTGKQPIIKRLCSECVNRRKIPLLEMINGVALDIKMEDGKIADVMLLSDCSPVIAIQIFVFHTEKRILGTDLPWFELNAREVIQDPTTWDSVCESLGYFECTSCEEKETAAQEQRTRQKNRRAMRRARLYKKRFRAREKQKKVAGMKKRKDREHREIKKLAHDLKINLPSSPDYTYKAYTCKACDKKTIVFSWNEHLMCNAVNPPPEPRPTSIQLRQVAFDIDDMAWMDKPRFTNARAYDEYWANTCSHCKTTIRDEHLYEYHQGPFGKSFFESRNKLSE